MKSPSVSTRKIVTVRVWDLPIRLFHWSLMFLVIACFASAKIGGDAMVWHFRFGYGVLTLLIFRLCWGVVGGRWARFTTFIYTPKATLRYLRNNHKAHESPHSAGHTPLGALSVFSMLLILMLQATAGLFADDEISNYGPFASRVATDISQALTDWHRNLGQWLIISLVLLHITAIVFYTLRKKQELIRPMLTGDKQLPEETEPSKDNVVQRCLALLLLMVSALAVAWLVNLEP